jgi:4'-phosphopantetheinyl transferase
MTNLDQKWSAPPVGLRLPANDIHVWRASLEQPVTVIQNLQQTLTADEVTRANRLYFDIDRNRFIVAHGILRTILSRYLDIDPSQLRFSYNSYGKPALDLPPSEGKLNLNISHSHNLALYAFTYSRQIGIDVEYIRSNIDYELLAKHFFSPYENAMLQALPVALQQKAFFNCWTRKEAYIKARGKGLSIPLHLFDVSLRPDEPAKLLTNREDPQEMARWSLQELAPGPGYAGALAVEGSNWSLSYWQW